MVGDLPPHPRLEMGERAPVITTFLTALSCGSAVVCNALWQCSKMHCGSALHLHVLMQCNLLCALGSAVQ